MKRFLFIIVILALPIPTLLSAQDAEETVTWAKTIDEVEVRTCPQLSCDLLTLYPAEALIAAQGIETGDEVAGNEEWVLVNDYFTGEVGYLPSILTEAVEPEDWMTRPVLPTVSDNAREIYQRGIEAGNDPGALMVVGDCQAVPHFFMGIFDKPDEYALGEYEYLQATIDNFAGSFSRDQATVDNGFNVASVLSPMWSDPAICEGSENPLECEYRLTKPSIAIISMETWWTGEPADDYEAYLREIVDFLLEKNVLPILATKADNLEGDHGLNAAVVRVAEEYDLPLWNFWLAVQPIPGHGVTTDGFHLIFARNFFDDPERLENGWPVRNLTALQALHAVWTGVRE